MEKRLGEKSQGKLPGINFEDVFFEDLVKDYLRDYQINERKTIDRAQICVNHLSKVFEGMRVQDITTSKIRAYIEKRLNDGVANGTINKELNALKKMMNLGAKQTPPLVDKVPYIPTLKENNVRKGFFEHGDFIALRDALPEHLKGFVTFGYKTGWRVSEIKNLTWSQVDLSQGVVYLNPGETKNDEGRTVYLDEELQEILTRLKENRYKSLHSNILPYVFLNENGTDKIKGFRRSWNTACNKAGIGKRLFHDFRRTAVRNMVRAGIHEGVAMMVSGHKTRSVFERYNIVSEKDLKEAARKQAEYLKKQTTTKTVTIIDLDTKKRQAN